MIGERIRAYREFRGLNQIQLAKLSGINVGTIRKYETGLRNPKPDQLEKIAKALGLNYSVFFDFNLETAGDIMSLLFAIDDAVDIVFSGENDDDGKLKKGTIGLHFEKATLEGFLKEWSDFKAALKRAQEKAELIEDPEEREAEFKDYLDMYEEWKLRKMGTNFGNNIMVNKKYKDDGLHIKMNSIDFDKL